MRKYLSICLLLFLGCSTLPSSQPVTNKKELEENQIYNSLDQALENPTKVRRLHWKVYKKNIPDFANLAKLTNLQELYLSSTTIDTIPEIIKALPNLVYLSLDYASMKEFPLWLYEMNHLEELHSLNNSMNQLSPKIGQLTNLQELSIAGKGYPFYEGDITIKLHTLPKALSQLKSLKVLRLNSQLFKTIPPVVLNMPMLEVIQLSNNGIQHISKSALPKWKYLKKLNIRNNPIPKSTIEELRTQNEKVKIIF